MQKNQLYLVENTSNALDSKLEQFAVQTRLHFALNRFTRNYDKYHQDASDNSLTVSLTKLWKLTGLHCDSKETSRLAKKYKFS